MDYVTRRLVEKIYDAYEVGKGAPILVATGIQISGKLNNEKRKEIADQYGITKILLVDTGKAKKVNYKVPVKDFMALAVKEVVEEDETADLQELAGEKVQE